LVGRDRLDIVIDESMLAKVGTSDRCPLGAEMTLPSKLHSFPQQLLAKGQIFEDKAVAGTESNENPA